MRSRALLRYLGIDPHKIDDSFFPTHNRVIVPYNSDILNPGIIDAEITEFCMTARFGALGIFSIANQLFSRRIGCRGRYCAQDECGGLTLYTLMVLDNAMYYVRVWNFQSRGIVPICDKNVKNSKHTR